MSLTTTKHEDQSSPGLSQYNDTLRGTFKSVTFGRNNAHVNYYSQHPTKSKLESLQQSHFQQQHDPSYIQPNHE